MESRRGKIPADRNGKMGKWREACDRFSWYSWKGLTVSQLFPLKIYEEPIDISRICPRKRKDLNEEKAKRKMTSAFRNCLRTVIAAYKKAIIVSSIAVITWRGAKTRRALAAAQGYAAVAPTECKRCTLHFTERHVAGDSRTPRELFVGNFKIMTFYIVIEVVLRCCPLNLHLVR